MDYKEGALSKKKEGGEKEKKPSHEKKHEGGDGGGSHRHPHMHVHSHEAGHTLHVMHDDGSHEMHHFAPGDHAGMSGVMAEHMAGAGGGMEPGTPGGAPAMAGGGGGAEEEQQA